MIMTVRSQGCLFSGFNVGCRVYRWPLSSFQDEGRGIFRISKFSCCNFSDSFRCSSFRLNSRVVWLLTRLSNTSIFPSMNCLSPANPPMTNTKKGKPTRRNMCCGCGRGRTMAHRSNSSSWPWPGWMMNDELIRARQSHARIDFEWMSEWDKRGPGLGDLDWTCRRSCFLTMQRISFRQYLILVGGAMGSLFTGSSIVHHVMQPDLVGEQHSHHPKWPQSWTAHADSWCWFMMLMCMMLMCMMLMYE